MQVACLQNARIGHKQINSAEMFYRFDHQVLNGSGVRHITLCKKTVLSELLHRGESLFFSSVGYNNLCSFTDQRFCNSEPKSLRTAGYNCDLPG